jgi:PAS domain S-box-containing protein
VAHYLQTCCRSRQLVPGALTLTAGGRPALPCRAEGAVLRPAGAGAEALVLLRLLPRQAPAGQSVALNEQIEGLTKEIHRSKQAEEVVRRQEEWLRVTLNSISDAVIVTDAEGRVSSLNRVACALTGWSPEAAVGRPLREVFPIVHEVTRQPQESPVEKALAEGVVVGLANHTVLLGRDGSERPIDDSAAPIKDEEGNVLGVALVFRDVTERRQVERWLRDRHQELAREVQERTAELRASEERFRLLVEGTTDYAIFMLDTTGHIASWNPGAERIKGYKAEDIIGQHFSRFYPEEAVRRGWPQYELERAAAVGRFEDEGWRVRKDGSQFWANVVITALRDEAGRLRGFSKITRDLTERKNAEESARRLLQEQAARQAAEAAERQLRASEEALRESEGRHRLLADVSAALVGALHYPSALRRVAELAVPALGDYCFFDVLSDGRLERVGWKHADPARQALADRVRQFAPPPEAENHPIIAVLRSGQSQLVPEVTDAWLRAAATGPDHLQLLRELGLTSLLAVPLLTGERRLGALTFCYSEPGRRHAPEQVQLAEEIARRAALTVENARLYHELREADRRKDEFLAVLAHELRNPLAPLSNALQVMRLTAVNEQTARVRDMMERQVRQMTRLVDDLLDVSRITRGKIVLRKERLDLAEVVVSALEASRPLIEAERHELTVTPSERPLFVEGDRARLAQVLSNLLTNAAKYTPEGGHIWLAVERRGPEAELRVRDNGVGIPAEMLSRVFEMFAQVERHLGRAQGGLGIGLTLVRSLVEMHGGTVRAYSGGPGQGSEFVVRLPLAADHPAGEAGAEAEAEPAAATRGRILVVDDSVDSAESLALMLKLSGNEVRTAYDGPGALATAATFAPDVVLLDIGMPGMDGYEVARRLRQQPTLRNALLIAQTGWGQEEDRRRSKEAGFDHHFTKPVDPATLEALLAARDAPPK